MHRHVLASVALLALGAVAACDTQTVQGPRARVPQGASSDAAVNQQAWIPDEFKIADPCNGGIVTVTGTLHVSTTVDPTGTTRIHANGADLSGTSTDGTQYRFVRVSQAEVASTNPLDELLKAQYRLISLGSQENFLLNVEAHLYVDATGFHADILKASAKCEG